MPRAGGDTRRVRRAPPRLYPAYAVAIRDEVRHADAVHVRCPANISLLALALLRAARRPEPRWVKYAGNWQPDGAEPWSYAVQRRWLAANHHRGVVTVNGQWPAQPPHVHTFHNPSLTEAQLADARHAAAAQRLCHPQEPRLTGAHNKHPALGGGGA